MNTPERLLEILSLERLGDDLFEGPNEDKQGRIFGGQVVAQALAAAYGTVETFLCHSLHAYFVRPGDASKSIRFEIERTRDGGSFASRRIKAMQDGRLIYDMIASFQAPEDGVEFQAPMPLHPPPETTPSFVEKRAATFGALRAALSAEDAARLEVMPFDVRTDDDQGQIVGPPSRQSWFRFNPPLGPDPRMHHLLLAYVSDLNVLATAMRPHGLYWTTPGLQSASLDHAVWFHRPTSANDWHLFLTDTPTTAGARGMIRGSIYNADGRLVATVAQEGLLRLRRG